MLGGARLRLHRRNLRSCAFGLRDLLVDVELGEETGLRARRHEGERVALAFLLIGQDREAELFLSGPGIVGLAFTPSRAMVVATTNALYRVDVGIKGRPLY